jgi:CRISPR-associated protein Csd1
VILSALVDLYTRLCRDDPESMPRPGWNRRNVCFALELSPDGAVERLVDLRDMSGKKPAPISILVPDHGEVRTSAAKTQPYFLCDGAAFLLGASAGMGDKALDYFVNARALHDRLLAHCGDPVARAILGHFASWDPAAAPALAARAGLDWEKEVSGQNMVFTLAGLPGRAHTRPALVEIWNKAFAARSPAPLGECLVTGETRPIARLHPGIKLPGTVGNGAPVVSFNADAFTSYGHAYHGMNAPVAEDAVFAYTAALNSLVARDSRRRLQLGDTTIVFWADAPASALSDEEAMLAELLGISPESEVPGLDTAMTQRVGAVLSALIRGVPARDALAGLDPDMRFYVLGIAAPGGSRVSLRFWEVSGFGDLARRVAKHHEALSIDKRHPKDKDFHTLRDCLRAAVPLGKDDNIPGPLAAALALAVFRGGAYPPALLALVLARMGTEHGPFESVSTLRAGLVKAVLTRSSQDWKPEMSLDPDDTDTAYRLGRLFAALERAQQLALGTNINASIKDRYFAAASSGPRSVFPNLIRLAQHHLSKAEKSGWLDRLIGDIVDAVKGFPATLSLDEQGRFALGYYHQRNALWSKKPETPESSPSTES